MPKMRQTVLAGGTVQKACPRGGGGFVQACPELVEGKAAAILTRGAYMQYVSANAAKSGKSVSPKVGKMARTPLAAFFNIPKVGISDLWVQK